jgi:hypothetical protein
MFHASDVHFTSFLLHDYLSVSIHAELSVSIERYLLLVPNVPVPCSIASLSAYSKDRSSRQQVASAHCFTLTMERSFSPCTRYRDSQGGHADLLRELKLDVSTEELLSAERAFTYADLYAMLENGDTVVWLTPHAHVVRADGRLAWRRSYDYSFRLNVDGQTISAVARSSEAFLEILDIVRRLLLADASQVYELKLTNVCRHDEVLFNAPSFAYLVEQCQSLKALTLDNLTLDEDHCHVLGNFSKPGLEIELYNCRISSVAAEALAEVLGRNQGPTSLNRCHVDYSVLANGLRGNSRLKLFRSRLFTRDARANVQEFLAIAGALKENKGLVDLNLWHALRISDETWYPLCDSLKTHPTLQVLSLSEEFGGSPSPSVLTPRIQALVDMLKVNMSMHTLHLNTCYSEHGLFQTSAIPYLESNRLRPRVRAIQKARPIAYRCKVLGRALLAVRTDPNHFWMLLSGNTEIAFPPTTATTAAAVSLPITTATNADVSTAAATGASTSDVATPTINQKRKAHPESTVGLAGCRRRY